jgi:glycosyltransferase involved in cell wall biosynthesis
MQLHPDITISLLRREINFINDIKDGSRKIGELHVNRANYRNFEANESNFIKNLFAKYWMCSLVSKLKQLDRFVVLTEEDKSAWSELQNICVIPDPLSFVPSQHSTLKEKRVIAVGRYVYQKGFDLLLHAWAKIEKQYPDWQLAIFGDGNREPYLQQMKVLGVDSSRCHLNGPTTDIQKEYVNSSVFAFTSRFEGFGMVLIEAMACGLPVVSFACPCGPMDIVKDGEDGLLVENGNDEDLADKLLYLMADDKRRRQMADAALKNSQRFNVDYIAERWKKIFNEVTTE